jgi:DNA primase
MDLKDYLENLGITPRKASTADGGEYSSSCPACGDGGKGLRSDRFRIWPAKKNDGGLCVGRFWCRRCGVSGDTIEFLQQFHNMDFHEACESLGITLTHRSTGSFKKYNAPPVAKMIQGWVPKTYPLPADLWQEKAGNLLADCKSRLPTDGEALAFLADRGISEAVAVEYGLGFNLSSKGKDRYRPRASWGLPAKGGGKKQALWIPRGWVIPCFRDDKLVQLRIRRIDSDIKEFAPEIKYLPLDGSSMATMVLNPQADIFAVVECGFDAILLASIFGDLIGIVTTWNSSARPDTYAHNLLAASSFIINLLDFDKGGNDQQAWWCETYPQNFRPEPPSLGCDPGEMFEGGVDIKSWLLAAVPRGLQIRIGGAPPVQQPPLPAAQKPASNDVAKQEQAESCVVEMDLSNGETLYLIRFQNGRLTDEGRREWHRLTGEGEAVFTEKEMAHLQTAIGDMEPREKLEAGLKAIEVKKMFGGVITGGRKVSVPDEVDEIIEKEES